MSDPLIDALAVRVADIICDRLNLTGWRVQEPERNDNIVTGWKAIANVLHMSESKAKRMRDKFTDNAIWQQVNGGAVYADKNQLINEYKTIK